MTERSVTLPAVTDFASLTLPALETVSVAPGVTLHLLRDPLAPKMRVEILYGHNNANSADSVRRAAVALADRLVMESTANRPADELADFLDFEGARLGPSGKQGYNGIVADFLPQSLDKITDLLYEVLTEADVPQQSLQTRVASEVQKLRYDRARIINKAGERADELSCGPDHPYAAPVGEDDLLAVTREMVLDVISGGLRGSHIHIFAAGNFDDPSLERVIGLGRRLSALQGEMQPVAPVVKYTPSPSVSEHIAVDDSLQTAIVSVIPVDIDRHHPDYSTLRLTVMALGGYFGSRLMTNIREAKGLTYGISASLESNFEGTRIRISAQCGQGTAALALDEIRKEIERLATEPMGADELTRLRRYAATQLATTLDSPFSILQYNAMDLYLGCPDDYFDRQFRAIGSLDADTIMAMTRRYIVPERAITVTAGSPL
ncbi:MAG: pitrilysin family protein [Bacteroidales bacterium]|nr:pitrilysin family protein [Bacteroidales bacterium]